MHCAVIGAGITGMSTALSLARRGATVELFEASQVLGGVARSVVFGGHRFCPGPQYLWGFGENEPASVLLAKLGVSIETLEAQPDFEQLKLGNDAWEAVGAGDKNVVRTQGDARFVAALDALGRAGEVIERRASFRHSGPEMVAAVRKAVTLSDLVEVVRARNLSVLDLAQATGASAATVRRIVYSQGIFAERLADLSAVLYAAARRHLLRPLRIPVGGVVAAIDALSDAVRTTAGISVHLGTRVEQVERQAHGVGLSTQDRSHFEVDEVVFCCSPGALPGSLRKRVGDFTPAHPIGVACFAVELNRLARNRLARHNFTWFAQDENPDVDFSSAGSSCRTLNFTVTTLNGLRLDADSEVARHVVCSFFPHGRHDNIEHTAAQGEIQLRRLLPEAAGTEVTILERLRLCPQTWNEHFGAFEGALYGRRLTSNSIRRSLSERMPERMHLAHSGAGIPGVLGCLQMGVSVAEEVFS